MPSKKKKSREEEQREAEKKRKEKEEVDNFVAPDGGWGWMVVLAAGFSNFCILPVLQSFGLIFRDRFEELGITASQTTTLLNINCAVTSCIGLANGPLFRRFSYRQVSFTGAVISAFSITMLSTMKTFTGALIFFSILYALGLGISMSSNALALNTYFKQKRRVATGLSWTCTGMGPIIMPQVITVLMPKFGMEGTVLIYGGIAFNAAACALLLQPVTWHVRKEPPTKTKTTKSAGGAVFTELPQDKQETQSKKIGSMNEFQSRSLENVTEASKANTGGALERAKQKFGSQYLYYDDEEDGAAGIDVMGPGTPMMSRANDGWFSRRNTSNASLASRSSKKDMGKNQSRRGSMSLSKAPSLMALGKGSSISRNLNRQQSETLDNSRRKISGLQAAQLPLIILNETCEHGECECKDEACIEKKRQSEVPVMNGLKEEEETAEPEQSRLEKAFMAVVIFFDLDLLRDLVYVNLMLGITFATFAELNFSLLTPFILSEYGYTRVQVATVMSVLAGVDVATRLTIPFIATFIEWENRTFFLAGICGIAVGRIVLAHVQDFGVTLAIAVLIGVGKALRTIFMALVIPGHVPLSRLPGASGIQLLASGIVSLGLGPIVGWIRDTTGDYVIMLHCLNVFTYLTAISWTLEVWFRRRAAIKAAKVRKTPPTA